MSPQAVDLLGDAVPTFHQDGKTFLLEFARLQKGRSFSSEDVTKAAESAGIAPRDLRHWGALFVECEREGVIVRDHSHLYRRRMGNGSLSAGWRLL